MTYEEPGIADRRRAGTCRALVHAAIGCAVLGLLISTWAVEGIVVPMVVASGSMAPVLEGPHVEWACTACGQAFDCGIESLLAEPRSAVCPTCGAQNDASAGVERPGSRVFVDRSAYAFGAPRRFDVVVVRSPDDPQSLCVKRVVGLPGEVVRIDQGDIWINGQIARKSASQQRQAAVAISSGPDRWHDVGGCWRWDGTRFLYKGGPEAPDPRSLLAGNHRGRFGRELSWGATAGLSNSGYRGRRAALLDKPAVATGERDIHWLVYRHPNGEILDDSPYDQSESRVLNPVSDILLTGEIKVERNSEMYLAASSGGEAFVARVAFGLPGGALIHNGQTVAHIDASRFVTDQPAQLEWVLADRQIRLLVDGRVLVEYCYDAVERRADDQAPIMAIGARGAGVELRDLKVLRDVYYSAAAGNGSWQLGPDEYFLLGDNSPHSTDSRSWSNQRGVSGMFIVGKAIWW